MTIAVVTFADDKTERYEHGIIRLKHSLRDMMSSADVFCFRTWEEVGSPSHSDVPYAFKACAINKVRLMGYDLVLWCDSVIHAIKDLKPIFKHIRQHGYIFFDNLGYTISSYTSDRCLDIMGMTREEAREGRMIMACCMGFNFRDKEVNQLVEDYYNHTKTGAYLGSWFNRDNEVSKAEDCNGHRHDQSVMSILLHQRNFNLTIGHETFFAYANNPNTPIGEGVSLISE